MKVLKVQAIPTLVTLSNLAFGVTSIVFATRFAQLCGTTGTPWSDLPAEALHALYYAAMCVCFSMVADMLDGKVARMTGGDSAFGAEIDSLSDIVSFGVAPAVLIKVIADNTGMWPRFTGVIAVAYAALAAIRLAHYNVQKHDDTYDGFHGLPTPAAAGALVSLVMLQTQLLISPQKMGLGFFLESKIPIPGIDANAAVIAEKIGFLLPFYMVFIGLLMVSNFNYMHAGKKALTGKKMPAAILIMIVICAGLQLEWTLVIGFTFYVFVGLIASFIGFVKKSKDNDTVSEPNNSDAPKTIEASAEKTK